MIKLTINDQLIEAREGQTVLEAAQANQITIPTLCYHKDLSPAGSCRLCVVEVDKIRGQVAACTQIVNEGMVAHTETPAIVQSRKMVLQLLLANYHDAGYATAQDPALNELLYWVKRYAVQPPRGLVSQPHYTVNSDPNPFVWVDWNKCILCTRCIRACAEVQGRFVWGVAQRGFDTKIVAGADTNMIEARCESCGACVVYCPTGALDHKLSMNLGQPDRVITTTCTYCGVGCQIDLNIKDNRIIRVTSNATAAVNGLAMCVKGRYGYDFVHHPDRLTKPRVRKYLLEGSGIRAQGSGHPQSAIRNPPFDRGEWIDVDWNTALNIVAKKLIEIKQQSGPDSIGVLASAKCTNEENYLMQKFARQVIGTHNVDHCARLCHSSTVAGLAMCYGSGAMSNSMEDIADNARAIFIIGSNTTEQHPVFGAKIRQAVLQRGVKLIVADPRKIDITEFATLHIRQKPGTDVALINGLMHIIFKNNWHDQKYIDERCENFEEFRSTIEKYPPELVSEITGVSIEQLNQAAELISINKPMAVFWAMGITQHTTGVFNVLSLGNLQMLLGNMGVPGGGVNPLRGQNNVQGACDMGALPNVFPGYQGVTEEKAREKFNRAWQIEDHDWPMDQSSINPPRPLFTLKDRPGLTVTEMIPQAGEGKVRALYILGEDPMLTDPDLNHVRECLEACEFTVLQEIFPSVTSEYADVLLPGASF
ncbi:MAG TPA: molybdopterin-dependent oxidoreductase, partial [Anaerolineae bacterium]|nr:molybdopterin-dependent oxidoreductase [Anaerolineae bacterium]